MKIELLIIDPQMDFCWPGLPDATDDVKAMLNNTHMEHLLDPGGLYVPGAELDMIRLADMVNTHKNKIDDIHVTLDSHHFIDIAHPTFWLDSKGASPGPFTIISLDDINNGAYRTTNPAMQSRAKEYIEQLAVNGRYPLCVWPEHCLIGRTGASIQPVLVKAIQKWEKQFATTDYVTKGSNIWTEHYSAIQADVPDPTDPGTQLNTRLIETLEQSDVILLAGEARSHCLANTVIDIADNFGDENIKKMILLTDATSDVPGFESLGEQFVNDMVARGMQLSTTVDFFK